MLYDRKDGGAFSAGRALLTRGCEDCLGKDPMEAVEEADILVHEPGGAHKAGIYREGDKRRESRFSRKSSWDI